MGYELQIQEICKKLPPSKQTMLVSATLPAGLVDFARVGLRDPTLIRLDTDLKISDLLTSTFFVVREEERPAALLYILKKFVDLENQKTIIFACTRHHVEYLYLLLSYAGISTVTLYGSMDASARKENVAAFRYNKVKVMLVTDVAARGIDIPNLDNVINYHFPSRAKLYVHRVGRTARAGKSGTALSILAHDEVAHLLDLFKFLGKEAENTLTTLLTDEEMRSPNRLFYGTIPVLELETSMDFVRAQLKAHVEFESIERVCGKAYKLYAETRSPASPEANKAAKSFDFTTSHPWLSSFLDQDVEKARQDILASIKQFRPSSNILELTSRNSKNVDEESAVTMQRKRKLHDHLIQKPLLPKPHTTSHQGPLDNTDVSCSEAKKERSLEASGALQAESNNSKAPSVQASKSAKRKQYKPSIAAAKKKKVSTKESSFKDGDFFLDYTPKERKVEDGYDVREKKLNRNVEDIIMSILPDDGEDIMKSKSHRKVWDRKRKKYIQIDKPEDAPKHIKVKNEAGASISKKYVPRLYQQWQQKTNLSIPRTGAQERFGANPKNEKPTTRIIHQPKGQSAIDQLGSGAKVKSELKTKDQIQKEKKRKLKNKMKNRPKRGKRKK